MLGSQPEAEDALQLVLLSAYTALRRDDRPVELKPWLYAVARNRCASVLRARRDEQPLGEERRLSTAGLALADEVEQREELRAMLGDVAGLPDDQRAALVLAELGDLTQQEIGMTLGVPTGKVKALVFQARTTLIGARRARDTPCEKIREQLATLRGSALRRTEITRHLESCAGCAAFREEIRMQRAALGCVLPVAPAFAFKQELLAGVLASGGSGAAVATGLGGTAASGALAPATVGGGSAAGAGAFVGSGAAAGATGVAAAAGSTVGAAKVLVAVIIAGGIAGGAAVTEHTTRGGGGFPPAEVRTVPRAPAPVPAGAGRTSAVPAAGTAVAHTPAANRAATAARWAATAKAATGRRAARAAARRARAVKPGTLGARSSTLRPGPGTAAPGRGTATPQSRTPAAGRKSGATTAPGRTKPRPAAAGEPKTEAAVARPTKPTRPDKRPSTTARRPRADAAKGHTTAPASERPRANSLP